MNFFIFIITRLSYCRFRKRVSPALNFTEKNLIPWPASHLMLLSKCPATMRTLVWLLPGVYSLVGSFLLARHELLRTEPTAVPPVTDMTPLMDVPRVPPAEGFTAMLAHERFDCVMLRNVAVVAVLPSKRLDAKLARVGSNS